MADFQPAVELVLQHEGGLSDNPADPGGLTNFGISQRAYPNVDIRGLTKEAASEIYQRDYWKPYMASQSDQHMANALLDIAVNQGGAVAMDLNHKSNGNLRRLQVLRLVHYASLTIAKPSMSQFLAGWFTRALDV